jgi:hypothetical protein
MNGDRTKGKPPSVKVYAMFQSEDHRQRYVPIGSGWDTQNSNLVLKIDAVPLEWLAKPDNITLLVKRPEQREPNDFSDVPFG